MSAKDQDDKKKDAAKKDAAKKDAATKSAPKKDAPAKSQADTAPKTEAKAKDEPKSPGPVDPTQTYMASAWKYTRPLTACRYDPSGKYVFFPDRPAEGLRLDELLASPCIPELFVAQPLTVDSRDGTCRREARCFWDGLYSQNPPINDFFIGRPRACKPDCCGSSRSTRTATRGLTPAP